MQFAFSPTRLEKEGEILINKKHSDLLSIFMHPRRKIYGLCSEICLLVWVCPFVVVSVKYVLKDYFVGCFLWLPVLSYM